MSKELRTDELIKEGFTNFFGAATEWGALEALEQLTRAGLSEVQILAGLEAGCKVMAEENGTTIELESVMKKFRGLSN